jgi:CTP-dependent riboflavin kinase
VLITLETVVWRGQGLAGRCMDEDNYISEALGVLVVRGSLNIYAEGVYELFTQDVRAASCRQRGVVQACPCTVGGVEAFILQAHPRNDRSPLPQPSTMFEIMSATHLRNALGLADLGRVQLVYHPAHVKNYRPSSAA